MGEHKSAVIQQFAQNQAEIVGASRFFRNDAVSTEALINSCTEALLPFVAGKHVLCIQDTTEINYAHHSGKLKYADEQLGPLGNNKDVGFFVHPTLVLDAQQGFPLGFGHIHLWNRCWDKGTKYTRSYAQQPIEEKESYRWIDSSLTVRSRLEGASKVTFIADREGDIYQEFALVPNQWTDVLIRSRSDRRLFEEEATLYESLASSELAHRYEIKIRGNNGRKKRRARLEVRFKKVRLQKPSKLKDERLPAYVELFVVEARESSETVPQGEDPILWRLLTTHAVETVSQAMEVIAWYGLRWWIEQLFRLLKTQGLCIESSQMEHGIALKKLAVMALPVALELLQLVSDRDGSMGAPAEIVFSVEEIDFLGYLQRILEGKTHKQQNPYVDGTLAWAAWMIGRLGGWTGYKRSSPPGPIRMKRGMERFRERFVGWQLARASYTTGGQKVKKKLCT